MNGDWAIEPIFKEAKAFKQRFTIVRLNKREGIINTKGEWIVEPRFYSIKQDFVSEILVVKDENNRFGYINLYVEWIVPPIYLEAKQFRDGYGEVLTVDGKKGYVDVNGKFYKRKP